MLWRRLLLHILGTVALPQLALAGEYTVQPIQKMELKAVFGQVQSKTLAVARSRLGGTVTSLKVSEGSEVKAGDELAVVVDDKLALQLGALDARLKGLNAELTNAGQELQRAKKLLASGVIAKTKADAVQTQYDVLFNQHKAAQSDRAVLLQQASEGRVFAPAAGRVLTVPVTESSVVMPGEAIARIASDGYFVRLSLPERHAAQLQQGSTVSLGGRGLDLAPPVAGKMTGTIVKIYPEIENGRVLADVEVAGLGDYFVGERTLVWVPVAQRLVLSVPASAVTHNSGLDTVRLENGMMASVIVGSSFEAGGVQHVEVLSGIEAGDKVTTP